MLLTGSVGWAQEANSGRSDASTGWSAPTHMTVTSRSPQLPATETLAIDIAPNGDTSIFATYPENSPNPDHRILLISKRWLAISNLAAKPGLEIDALDGPLLTMQLVTRFLERAYPQGPMNLKKKEAVDVKEDFRPIRVNTMSAEGGWEAPWRMQGTLQPGAGGAVSYDLVVLQAEPGDTEIHKIEFSGEWERKSNAPGLPDSLRMGGWKVYLLTPKAGDGGRVTDFSATEQSVRYATLGDLRGVTGARETVTEPQRKKATVPSSLTTPLQRY